MLIDGYLYLAAAGTIQLAPVAAALAIVAFMSRRRHRAWGWATARRVLLFAALLLSLGAIANAVWMFAIYGTFYVSQDVVVDFWPFIPIGQWTLDQTWAGERGQLLRGTTLWQLRAMWAVAATSVWVANIVCYRSLAATTGAHPIRVVPVLNTSAVLCPLFFLAAHALSPTVTLESRAWHTGEGVMFFFSYVTAGLLMTTLVIGVGRQLVRRDGRSRVRTTR